MKKLSGMTRLTESLENDPTASAVMAMAAAGYVFKDLQQGALKLDRFLNGLLQSGELIRKKK